MASTPPSTPPERSQSTRIATWALFALVVFTLLAVFNNSGSSDEEVSYLSLIHI